MKSDRRRHAPRREAPVSREFTSKNSASRRRKAFQVYLNYDQYEDTYLERPSTKPQGIAHVISSATSFTKKGETIY